MKKLLTILMVIMIAAVLTCCGGGEAEEQTGGGGGQAAGNDPSAVLTSLCKYVAENAGSFSPEDDSASWMVFCLKESGSDAADEDQLTAYYDSLRGFVKSHKGVLSEDRYTTYERTSMAVKALGQDPTSVEGYDLMAPVDNYEGVCYQGINAEIYALISSHYTGYTLKNEEKYKKDILDAQTEDGGISFNGNEGDVDITAMAIQALSFYNDAETKAAVESACAFLSSQQQDDGSYGNCESTAQVIIALGTLKGDPAGAADFVKDGKTLIDGLMLYRTADGFTHKAGGDTDMMATQQAMLALIAAEKGAAGESVFE